MFNVLKDSFLCVGLEKNNSVWNFFKADNYFFSTGTPVTHTTRNILNDETLKTGIRAGIQNYRYLNYKQK